jgi:hypothetical protein
MLKLYLVKCNNFIDLNFKMKESWSSFILKLHLAQKYKERGTTALEVEEKNNFFTRKSKFGNCDVIQKRSIA